MIIQPVLFAMQFHLQFSLRNIATACSSACADKREIFSGRKVRYSEESAIKRSSVQDSGFS